MFRYISCPFLTKFLQGIFNSPLHVTCSFHHTLTNFRNTAFSGQVQRPVYIYTYILIHTYIHTYIHTHTLIHKHIHKHTHAHSYTYIHIFIHTVIPWTQKFIKMAVGCGVSHKQAKCMKCAKYTEL
jgi:hypothetical protein